MGMGSKLCLDPRYVFILFNGQVLIILFILVLYYKSRTMHNVEGERWQGRNRDDTGMGSKLCLDPIYVFILFISLILTIIFVLVLYYKSRTMHDIEDERWQGRNRDDTGTGSK